MLRAILRGENPPWTADAGPNEARAFLALCQDEGLAPLVHFLLQQSPVWSQWPGAVREGLGSEARRHAVLDLLRERQDKAVLADLACAGVGMLLLKGAPLAYSHYPQPQLRTRCDTDILVRRADRLVATRVLEAAGYTRPNAVSGTLVSYEETFRKRVGHLDHVVDLHWQISNSQLIARALTYEDARDRSVTVPQLGSAARTLSPPDAMLLACMHRAVHLGVDGPGGDRLIWLYDIHLLAAGMSSTEWQEFVRMCAGKGMREVSRDSLLTAQAILRTRLPAGVLEALEPPVTRELSANYLQGNRALVFQTELRALAWRDRIVLLRETLFPPADYMLIKYDSRRRWLLPWWYLRRAVAGGLRVL